MNDLKSKTVVIIPAYEPPREFADYAREVAKNAKMLIVVNDGSGEKFNSIFEEISQLENVKYLAYTQNQGKGYALKYAFKYCKDILQPDDVIVTADCDGQHKIKDVLSVAEFSARHGGVLVLGSRNFRLPNIPKKSLSGNTMIRWIFRALYGLNIYDTQTGLRAFSASLLPNMISVKGNRFEYEMGVLIYASKKGIRVAEIPIETVYPENPKEHITHYRAIKDSARMLGVVLKNLNFYILSSVISAVLDVLAFFLISTVLLKDLSAVNTLIATVGARVLSSVFNFIFNFKYVFDGKSKRSVYRYYILWFFQLGASYGLVFLFGNIIGLPLTPTKIICDLLLALASYQIQRHWVFSDTKKEFWGFLSRFLRKISCIFSKTYRSGVVPYEGGSVYVARHLDMHGPYTTLKWIGFDVHPMVFYPFFTAKDCYRQYADFTFTARKGKKKKRFNFKAWIASRFVPLPVRSMKSIPVYRRSIDAVKTFRCAVDVLEKGENIIVYADVEYTASAEKVSEIYDGFLYLGSIYKKKTGKSLKFIPIYIDEERRTINESAPVYIDNFKKDKDAAREYIKLAVNNKLN